MDKVITMAHGSGGRDTDLLIKDIFARYFDNDTLNQMEDSAVVNGNSKIAMTTDSFVVTPTIFPGGDIGRLCICGTVNDLLMRGAIPKYITCGFILQEGLEIDSLKYIVKSMAETAKEAGVSIVAGDTKVVEGKGELYINTAGVGFINDDRIISSKGCQKGDSVIVSGNLGDHHSCILSQRMSITNDIKSDCAPLCDIVNNLLSAGIKIHALRDITRGGLATVLKELAISSNVSVWIDEENIPVLDAVKGFSGLLGLDPLYMGNEGKLVAVIDKSHEKKALEIIRNSAYGRDAKIVGHIEENEPGKVLLKTGIGGIRNLDVLMGEGLPRIC
ncbi:MAG: hydrogenase expression/formation protein HypE [Lachnospira sp.]